MRDALGKYIAGDCWLSVVLRTSPTTPTTVKGFLSATRYSTRPRGSSLPQNFFAVASLTIITRGAAGPSASVKARPRTSGIAIVRKKPGLTIRQSIGMAVSGGITDFPTVATGVVV